MQDPKQLSHLIEWALKLSDEDLRQAVEFLNQEYRVRIRQSAYRAALTLKSGDWVEVMEGSRKLPVGARGHVVAIRGKSGGVDVHFPDQGMWTISATLLRKVDGPSKK